MGVVAAMAVAAVAAAVVEVVAEALLWRCFYGDAVGDVPACAVSVWV